MTKWKWRLRRLMAMSPAELAYRLRQALQSRAERLGIGLAPAIAGEVPARTAPAWFALQPPGIDVQRTLAEADRLLQGRWRVFALHDAPLGFPPDWSRDPKTGLVTPADRPGKSIDYRDERLVGDIKYLWEINRHLELVTLAQAWRLGGDERHLRACATFIDDWLRRSPYPLGLNWASSLELGIRLVNWSVAWHLLGAEGSPLFAGAAGQRLRDAWLRSVHQHMHFIRGHLSRHSSANNHLLGELMGLVVAGCTWPALPQAAGWAAFAAGEFEREALLQNTRDGINREQALYYQHEVMEMMLVCAQAGAAGGLVFAEPYHQRLQALAHALAALGDDAGHYPMLGDADDAAIVRWTPGPPALPYASLVACVATRYRRAGLRGGGVFDERCAWLLGSEGADWWQAQGAVPLPPLQALFPEGGLHVLGCRRADGGALKLVFDCAPLGYLSIAAHGHADALAFTLSAWGEEWLVDPGTFAYHTQALWRNHFRSTAAHNTLCVDGADQSEIGGNFLWMQKARARLLSADLGMQRSFVEGEHDGYTRLRDPVLHRRRVELDHASATVRVVDSLRCRGAHAVLLAWQFAEHIEVQLDGDQVLAAGRGGRLRMRCEGGLVPELRHGALEPPRGWVSRRFDQRAAAPWVGWAGRIEGDTTLVTTLAWN